MHDKPLSEQQSWLIEKILTTVRPRTKNEIEKIRQRDNLIMMKNAALQDAESKIKFLADMSHEIRFVVYDLEREIYATNALTVFDT